MSNPGPGRPPHPGQPHPHQPPPRQGAEPDGFVTPGQPGPLMPSRAPAPGGVQGPTGQLVLELRPPVGMISESMITPVVTIDGQQVPAHWHTNVLTVPAGARQIVVGLPYMLHSGHARFTAQVQPGQRTVVHYAAPASMHHRGAIGHTPPRNHTGWLLAIILGGGAVALLVVIGIIIWAVMASPG